MSAPPSEKRPFIDATRIGEYAAQQPLSGVVSVNGNLPVSGLGHGAYVRAEEAEQQTAPAA